MLNGELFLHYQPIFRVGADTVCAVEALMRWEHPGGAISPRSSCRWRKQRTDQSSWRLAIRCACAQLAAWDASGRPGYVSVNLCRR
ncbi:EAL domain-containing protein [Cupriavidus basilensis]